MGESLRRWAIEKTLIALAVGDQALERGASLRIAGAHLGENRSPSLGRRVEYRVEERSKLLPVLGEQARRFAASRHILVGCVHGIRSRLARFEADCGRYRRIQTDGSQQGLKPSARADRIQNGIAK